MYGTVYAKTNAYAGLEQFERCSGHLQCVVATYNAYNDELSMVLYIIDQMQGIKLTRLKRIHFHC